MNTEGWYPAGMSRSRRRSHRIHKGWCAALNRRSMQMLVAAAVALNVAAQPCRRSARPCPIQLKVANAWCADLRLAEQAGPTRLGFAHAYLAVSWRPTDSATPPARGRRPHTRRPGLRPQRPATKTWRRVARLLRD